MSDFGGFSEFTVGSVIGRAWRVMWQKFHAFLGITLLSSGISVAVAALLGVAIGTLLASFNIPGSTVVGASAVFISFLMVSAIFQGALTYAIFMLLLNGWASIGEAFKRSARRVLSLILGILIMIVALGLLLIVPIIIVAWASIASGVGGRGLVVIVTAIGFVFFIITLIRWSVFAPACVIERAGPIASLGRSSKLTKGYGWKIFGIFVLMGIVMIIFSALTQFIANKIFGAGILGNLFATIVGAIPMTYFNVLPAVIYYSLRVVKENLTPDSLADIFD